jgi:hypothetical protein
MHEFVSKLLESPVEAGAVSLGVVLLGYFTIVGLKKLFSKPEMKHSHPPGPSKQPFIGAIGSFSMHVSLNAFANEPPLMVNLV